METKKKSVAAIDIGSVPKHMLSGTFSGTGSGAVFNPRSSMPIWLNLGCGDDLREGFINVDLRIPRDCPVPYHEWNLEADWPWKDSTVDYILARDIIEHLPEKIHTMNEAWRVLKPGGVIHIEVPTTNGPGAFQDPTHVSFWNEHSFWYFEAGNPYRERFAKSYGINAAFRVLRQETVATSDGPKLLIELRAVK